MMTTPANGSPATHVLQAIPVPGGVAAPDRETIFVTAVHGGVQAVALETGDVRWSTNAAAAPLLATDSLLVAVASTNEKDPLVLVLLDASTGALIATSRPLSVPPGQWELRGISADANAVSIWWAAHPTFGGAPPHIDDLDAGPPARSTARAHRVSMRDAATESLDAELPPWAAIGARSGGGIPDADGALFRWSVDGAERAVVVRRGPDGATSLVLSADGAPHMLLVPAPAVGYVDVFVSDVGARLILLVTNDTPIGAAAPGTVLTWHVFSVPDGTPVGTLPFEPGTEVPAASFGDQFLLRDAEGVLHCIALPSGAKRWSVATAGQIPIGRMG